MQEAARAKGLQLRVLKASTESEIETVFATLAEVQAGALLPADPLFDSRRDDMEQLAPLGSYNATEPPFALSA